MKSLLTFALSFLLPLTLSAAEREVRLDRDFGTLYGTLRTPDAGSRVAALLIAGSGPTDRNCNSALGLYTDSFVYLARALEKEGIASLRFDKRGIGASRYDDPEQIARISFDDYIGDAAAWVAWLRDAGYEKVVLIGHSEGSLIALCVAAGAARTEESGEDAADATDRTESGCDAGSGRSNGTDAAHVRESGNGYPHCPAADAAAVKSRPDAVISLAGAGFPLDRVVLSQLSSQYDIGILLRATDIFNSLRQGKTVDEYPHELSMLFQPYLQRYWISQLRYDPQEMIRRVRVPVLIVNGTNDLQIPVANAEALLKAKPDAEILLIEGMTHPLKQSEGRDADGQMAAYMDASLPLDPTLAQAVPRFILGL